MPSDLFELNKPIRVSDALFGGASGTQVLGGRRFFGDRATLLFKMFLTLLFPSSAVKCRYGMVMSNLEVDFLDELCSCLKFVVSNVNHEGCREGLTLNSWRGHPRRRNVAAQVAEELKTVTYATPPMEKRRKKDRKLLEGVC